jgi:hypothetical protein
VSVDAEAESIAGKEAHMRPQTGPKQHLDRQAETREKSSGPSPSAPLVQLSDEQKRVLDCLEEAGTGLTLRQLEVRTSSAAPALQDALDGLLAQSLVARLNTLIPSYAYRYPGLRIYAE